MLRAQGVVPAGALGFRVPFLLGSLYNISWFRESRVVGVGTITCLPLQCWIETP